jgi:hypothetical protein
MAYANWVDKKNRFQWRTKVVAGTRKISPLRGSTRAIQERERERERETVRLTPSLSSFLLSRAHPPRRPTVPPLASRNRLHLASQSALVSLVTPERSPFANRRDAPAKMSLAFSLSPVPTPGDTVVGSLKHELRPYCYQPTLLSRDSRFCLTGFSDREFRLAGAKLLSFDIRRRSASSAIIARDSVGKFRVHGNSQPPGAGGLTLGPPLPLTDSHSLSTRYTTSVYIREEETRLQKKAYIILWQSAKEIGLCLARVRALVCDRDITRPHVQSP